MSDGNNPISPQDTVAQPLSLDPSGPVQVIGFDIDQPHEAVLPRRRSSVSSHNRAQIRRSFAKPSTSTSTPTIPQGIPVDGSNFANVSAIQPAAAQVQPRKVKLPEEVCDQTGNNMSVMLEQPVSPGVVGLSSGSEAGGSSCLSGYRSGTDSIAAHTAYSTAPTSVNNTAASTPAALLSGKFPPKTQQLVSSTSALPSSAALGSDPYAQSQPGASRLAQAAVANMAKRGMMMGKGRSNDEDDGEEHPLSEKALAKR